MTEEPPQPQTSLEIEVPNEIAAGVYADFLSVWNNQYGFTLDFGAYQPNPQLTVGEDGTQSYVQPVRLVARVKVPVRAVMEILTAISTNLDRHETIFGSVHGPVTEPPLFPPAPDTDNGGE